MSTRAVRRGMQGFAVACATAVALSIAAYGADSHAAALTTGRAYVSFDFAVFAEWGLRLEAFIDADGNALPVGPVSGDDLLDTAIGEIVDPEVYTLNPPGVDVTPLEPRRRAPPTAFSYDVSTLPGSASGPIALAGVSRWVVDAAHGGGKLLLGDYALSWNAAASQWQLSNYIDFSVVTFTLANVQTTTGPGDAFSVSGDLIASSFLGLLLPGAAGRDFGHFTFSTIEIACADGVDDDGDGRVDLADPGCTDAADASERGANACDDGIDDDGDGGIDFRPDLDGDGLADAPGDIGCASITSNNESPRCQDGIDNDGDGKVDWDGGPGHGTPDPQCTKPTRDSESPSSCGIGAELTFAMALLGELRRRSRIRRDGSGFAR